MFSLSNSSCVDSTFNNLFAFLDFLHLCKMLIFIIIIFCKSVNVGHTFFSVVSQDIMRFDVKNCTP